MIKKLLLSGCFAFALLGLNAQLKTPAPSPSQTIKQEFGISSVELNYSRPSAKGRTIFGDLVPYGKLWRTGANAATRIKFADDVTIGGTLVKAGEYSFYTIPSQNEWEVIFNKSLKNWGVDGYAKEDDVARIKVKSMPLPWQIETLTMSFDDVTASSMNLFIGWEKTGVNIPISIDSDSKIMSQIDNLMNKDNRPYFAAASYYATNGKDLNQAIQWFDKAIEQNPGAFWIYHQKANALVKAGKKKEAKEAAMKSLELAKEAKNDDYVKLNEKLIKSL